MKTPSSSENLWHWPLSSLEYYEYAGRCCWQENAAMINTNMIMLTFRLLAQARRKGVNFSSWKFHFHDIWKSILLHSFTLFTDLWHVLTGGLTNFIVSLLCLNHPGSHDSVSNCSRATRSYCDFSGPDESASESKRYAAYTQKIKWRKAKSPRG